MTVVNPAGRKPLVGGAGGVKVTAPADRVPQRVADRRRNVTQVSDHVLVGPTGVSAVEVKRRRIRLHVVGEEWWFEKLSSRGNAVDTALAVDGGGRSWARQVARQQRARHS